MNSFLTGVISKQGSPRDLYLVPLLFLVYVNDIVDIIRSNIRLNADDVTLYITVDDPIDSTKSAETLNKDLKEIEKMVTAMVSSI